MLHCVTTFTLHDSEEPAVAGWLIQIYLFNFTLSNIFTLHSFSQLTEEQKDRHCLFDSKSQQRLASKVRWWHDENVVS